MKKLVYLSLGSNLGDRRANLESAIARLGELGEVKAISSFYETDPVEFTNQPEFLNCAVALETDKMPRQFLAATHAIEHDLGRRRAVPTSGPRIKGPRTIDIDILIFGRAIVNTAQLTIPHPALGERRFVLAPLAEIAPELRHPVTKKTVREMLQALPAGGPGVRKVKANTEEKRKQRD